MTKRLYLLLSVSMCVSLLLFASLYKAEQMLESHLTTIDTKNQQLLMAYAEKAERYYTLNDTQGANAFFHQIQKQHDTWAAIITHKQASTLGTQVPEDQLDKLSFQRKVHWPVHSQWDQVLIGIHFKNAPASFVIRLPQSMHPRPNLRIIHVSLTLILPLLILLGFSHWFYLYLIRPVNILKTASVELAQGNFDHPVKPQLGKRKDELAQLADTFDFMAGRIKSLVASQRQLIGDLSHELRTPLTRMGLAVESHSLCHQEQKRRIEQEISLMNQLVEDAMTLAWLDSEHNKILPVHLQEDFSLSLLLDLICDDADFEFSHLSIKRHYPNNLRLEQSHNLALSQVIENIIRNGLMHSPDNGQLLVTAQLQKKHVTIEVQDQGIGVPEDQLERIFQPFYRLDKARMRKKGGFGLGLSLARKQAERLGGKLFAYNSSQGGLVMSLTLPIKLNNSVD